MSRYQPAHTMYFVERASALHVQRYHVLQGNTVVRTVASRPDGVEVPRPVGVHFAVSLPPQIDPTPVGPLRSSSALGVLAPLPRMTVQAVEDARHRGGQRMARRGAKSGSAA